MSKILKIRDDVDLNELKKFGFKISTAKDYYDYSNDEMTIFVSIHKSADYKKRCIYIECENYSVIFTKLDVLYDLIKADLVEVIEVGDE